jgi:hypothetical protein
MYNQDAMWEMNRAHHQELLDTAAKHRLLVQGRRRCPPLLDSFLALIGQGRKALRREAWSDGQWASRPVMR